MLITLYEQIGFFGTLGLMFLIFASLILWVAGIAGLVEHHSKKSSNVLRLIICVLVPPYPVIWLLFSSYTQYKTLNS